MDTNIRILVTGGNGFIGSNLLEGLIKEGYSDIVNVDNLSGAGMNSKFHINYSCVNIYGDVSNHSFLEKIFENYKFDVVFHLAANANVPFSDKFPSVDFNYNAAGTFNVLNCSLKYNVRKVIYASTAAVYGEPNYVPIDEMHSLNPVSNYGVTKLYGEKLGLCYYKTYGLPFTALRIFNTYGPRQTRYVLHDLIQKLAGNSNILQVLGTGEQIRDYSYVKDTVAAFINTMKSDKSTGQVFNIAGGNPITIRQLVSVIIDALNINPEVDYTGKSWAGDILNLTADISKIVCDLDFKPRYNLARGMEETIEWFRNVYDLPAKKIIAKRYNKLA